MEATDDGSDALRAAAQPLHWRGHRAPRRSSRAVARRAAGALRSRLRAAVRRVRAAGVRSTARPGTLARSGTGSGDAPAVLAASHPNLPVPHADVA